MLYEVHRHLRRSLRVRQCQGCVLCIDVKYSNANIQSSHQALGTHVVVPLVLIPAPQRQYGLHQTAFNTQITANTGRNRCFSKSANLQAEGQNKVRQYSREPHAWQLQAGCIRIHAEHILKA